MSEPKTPPPVTTAASVHLDALRGAAALLVFLNHTRALYFASPLAHATAGASSAMHAAATENTLGGENGTIQIAKAAVIVFFVLSGYLVGGSVLRSFRTQRWSWKSYLTKRLVRLLIVLVPAVLIGTALDHLGARIFGPGSIYTAPPGLHLTVSAQLAERSTPKVILGNLLFLQDILVPVEGTNVALWSLSNEFWYYLLFPLAVCMLFSPFSRRKRAASLVGFVAILWFVGGPIRILFPIWLMGAAVSVIPFAIKRAHARIAACISVVLLVASILAVRLANMNSVPAEYVIGLFTSILLYCIVRQDWNWMVRPTWTPAETYRKTSRFFSEISYSLYLFHLPLAVLLCAAVNSPWHSWKRTPRTFAWYVLSDFVVLYCVYLFWRLFEARTESVRLKLFRLESRTKV